MNKHYYSTDTIEAYLINHIRADGPVSFQNCFNYLNEQSSKVEYFELTQMFNNLIREKHIELYDTGDAFVTYNQ